MYEMYDNFLVLAVDVGNIRHDGNMTSTVYETWNDWFDEGCPMLGLVIKFILVIALYHCSTKALIKCIVN